ncbi:MAG: hypothetical protein Q9200_005637 [Gallowayella weberi]
MAESRRASSSVAWKDPLVVGQGKAKPQRLHPRQLGIYKAAEPVAQPVQTSVASFINVVLDSGGISVGNVLVPAESTIFNLAGYGPLLVINNERVILWFDFFSNDELRSATVKLRYCVVSDHTNNKGGCIPPKEQFNHFLRHFFADNLGINTDYDGPSTSYTSATSTTPSSSSSLSSSSISSSSASATSTFVETGVAGGGGTPTGTNGDNPSSSTAAAVGSGGGSTPSTPTLVGGVVGGLAGLALITVLVIFLLRRRRQIGQRRNISPPIPQSASTGPGATSGTTTERSSAAVPFASAAFFRRLRPGSGATASTTETAPSERGFQNLGGRKLESILSSRGDGYGDLPFGAASTSTAPGASSARGQPPPSIPIVTAAPSAAPGHSSPESLSGSSFYRDSQGFYGGPGQGQPEPEPTSNSSSMVVGPASPPQSPRHAASGSSQRHEGVAVMRPGPARTPVTTQGGLSPMRGPPTRGTPPPPQIPGTILERPRDGLGRSHPSMDGSRGSRFAENI